MKMFTLINQLTMCFFNDLPAIENSIKKSVCRWDKDGNPLSATAAVNLKKNLRTLKSRVLNPDQTLKNAVMNSENVQKPKIASDYLISSVYHKTKVCSLCKEEFTSLQAFKYHFSTVHSEILQE